MVGAPYGEARRLAYFRLICHQAEKLLPCETYFLIDRIIEESKKRADWLNRYKRTTGRMGTINVCYNYLRFLSWLDFLKIEGALVSKTAYTVFFSTLHEAPGFNLSSDEKLAYFIHLWPQIQELKQLLQMLSMSTPLRSGAFTSLGLTEHSAESYLEWLVDLDLAGATRRRFGAFFLSGIGNNVKMAGRIFQKAFCAYASDVIGAEVTSGTHISHNYVWSEMVKITRDISLHIRSPVDPNLVSALPVLLHLQIRLVKEKHTFLTRKNVIELVKRSVSDKEAIFSWDSSYNTGFLKFA